MASCVEESAMSTGCTDTESSTSSSAEREVKKRKKKKKVKKHKKVMKENKKAKVKCTWTNEKIVKLIELYEERPCLWDVFSQEYHNRDTANRAKAELEVSLIVFHSGNGAKSSQNLSIFLDLLCWSGFIQIFTSYRSCMCLWFTPNICIATRSC